MCRKRVHRWLCGGNMPGGDRVEEACTKEVVRRECVRRKHV